MDDIVRMLQDKMLSGMAAGSPANRELGAATTGAMPPPPSTYRDEMLADMIGTTPDDPALSGPAPDPRTRVASPDTTAGIMAGAQSLGDPVGWAAGAGGWEDVRRFATDVSRPLGSPDSPLQETLGAAIRGLPDFARAVAKPDPIDLLGGPMGYAAAPMLGVAARGTGNIARYMKNLATGKPNQKVTELDDMAKFVEQWIDKLEPIRQFDEDLYKSARNHAGTAKKAEEAVMGFGETLSPIRAKGLKQNFSDFWRKVSTGEDRIDDVGKWMVYDRMEEVAKRTDDAEAALKAAQNKKAIETMRLGPEGTKAALAAREAMTERFNKLLDEAVDSGLISSNRAKWAKEKNLRYVPLHVLADDAASDLGPTFRASARNPNTDWFKNLYGADDSKPIQNPIDAIAKRVSPQVAAIEKNNLMRYIVDDVRGKDGFDEFIVPLETADMRAQRVVLGGEIQKKQAEMAWLAHGLKKLNRVGDKQIDRFMQVQKELAGFGVELAELDLKYAPRKEMKAVINKIQNRQSSLIAKAQKLKDNDDTAGVWVKELLQSEEELKAIRKEMALLKSEKLPDGFKEIHAYRDGFKERWAVPASVADSLSSLGQQQIDLATRVASYGSKALRAGATSLNAPFMVTNTLRDAPTMVVRSKTGMHLGNAVQSWASGFWSALRKDEYYKQFIEDGGGYSTFAEVLRAQPRIRAGGVGDTLGRVVRSPAEMFDFITSPVVKSNEVLEMAPRLAEYKRAIKQGMSNRDAAFLGRDITVDFMKSGHKTKVFNMWIPFLNASVQGNLNTLNTARHALFNASNNKMTLFNIGTVIGVPAATTYAWNTTYYPEVWDDIQPFEKNNYHIIIHGNGKDENGRYNEIVKIPKDHASKLLTGTLLESMEYMRRKEPVEFKNVALSLLDNLSPVGGVPDDRAEATAMDTGMGMIGAALPPFAKAPAQYMANYDVFTGQDIENRDMQSRKVVDRYRPEGQRKTPAAYRALGEKLSASPVKLENAANTLFGGLAGQLAEPTLENIKKQFARRFTGAHGGYKDSKEIKKLEKMKLEEGSRIFHGPRRLVREGKAKEIKEYASRGDKEYDEIWRASERRIRKDAFTPLDNTLKYGGLNADAKRKWALNYMQSLSKEERNVKLKHWEKYEVLSGTLLEELKQIK